MTRKFSLPILLILLVACDSERKADEAWVKPASESMTCEDYATVELDSVALNNGVLTNNVWNKHAAGDKPWEQCLVRRQNQQSENGFEYGWYWQWPRGKRVVYGQPQIKLGISPWAPAPHTDFRFPAQISQLNKLRVSIDTQTSASGNFNVVTTAWLTNAPMTGIEPRPDIITTEVMVWTYASEGQFTPAGKHIDTILVDGQSWELWHEASWDDPSGKNPNRWIHVAFRASENSFSSTVDYLALLNEAVSRGLISKHDYVSDIELGNEVMSGRGLTWVRKFDIELESKVP